MECPKCGSENYRTVDSRDGKIRRRRKECNSCGIRWSTVEINAEDYERLLAEEETLNELKELIKNSHCERQ